MLQEYIPVLIFLGVAAALGGVLLGLGFLIGTGRKDEEKLSPYECGFEAFDDSRMKFDVRYYLVAILFAIGMFRASGAMDFMVEGLRPLLGIFGVPPEVLPMMIMRPLTGSGSAAIVLDMINQFGEDSILVKMVATMFGSTETTFYVIAVYFGAVNIKKTRHAVPAGLIADIVAMFAAIFVVKWLFG